jgi:hypothetical protein
MFSIHGTEHGFWPKGLDRTEEARKTDSMAAWSSLVRATGLAMLGLVGSKYQAMKSVFVSATLLFVLQSAMAAEQSDQFDIKAADRFAKVALACVHKEYPNKISLPGTVTQMWHRRAS